MFQKNKFSHMVTVQCSDGEHEATYTFIEGPDDDYGEITKEKFYEEFGSYPTSISRISYEKM